MSSRSERLSNRVANRRYRSSSGVPEACLTWRAALFAVVLSVSPGIGDVLLAAPLPIPAGQMLQGHFVQERTLAGFSGPLRSAGTFILVPDRGLIWRAEEPFKMTVVITSAGMSQSVNGEQMIRVSASQIAGLNELYEALEAALSGNFGPLGKSFEITQNGDPRHWQVRLVAKTGSSFLATQLKSLTLSGTRYVEQAEVDKGGGDSDHLAFTGQTVAPINLSSDESKLLKSMSK